MTYQMKTLIALFFVVFFWSSAFVGIRVGLQEYSPGSLALLRFLIASFCMVVVYFYASRDQAVAFRDKCALILIGVAGIGVYHICLNYGEITVSAGVASFIIGLIPVFSILLSVLFLKERLSLRAWLGVFISVSGLYVILLQESQGLKLSQDIGIVLIAALMGAIHSVTQKRYLSRYHPIAVTAWILWGGTLSMMMFFPTLCIEMPHVSLSTTAAVVYLGIFPAAVAYLAWSYVLEHMTVTTASLSLYAMPLMSTLLAYIYLGECPAKLSLLGGVIALFGAIIAHVYGYRPLASVAKI